MSGTLAAVRSFPSLPVVLAAATGGESISCCDATGKVVVNGKPLTEPYLGEDSPIDAAVGSNCESRRFGPVNVPADAVFAMGDHRLVSYDSRCRGPVPVTAVIAVVAG